MIFLASVIIDFENIFLKGCFILTRQPLVKMKQPFIRMKRRLIRAD
ncbi:MAG: hypothetical protein LBL74_06040 [Bacteroidales bacterium]|nr:hypothetical protein [Bacteroidales bacterium]